MKAKLTLLLLCIPFISLFAKDIALNVSVFNEKIALPFVNSIIDEDIHPGIQLGVEFYHINKSVFRLYQPINLFVYYHANSFQGTTLGVTTEIAFALFIQSFFTELHLGAGYMHAFSTLAASTWNAATGRWERNYFGRPGLLGNGSFGLGMDLREWKVPLKVYLRYTLGVFYAFQSSQLSPVVPISEIHLGVGYYLGEVN